MDFLRVKKLPGVEGGLAYAIRPRNIITDPGKMSCTVTITTEAVDRSRDVVVTKGLDLSDHRKNPVALLDHNQKMPVGLAQDADGGYTCKHVGDHRIDATTFFHQHTALGEQAFRLVESGVLRGASIGFLPRPGKIEKGHDRDGGVTIYGAGSLIEYSHLVLPDNPDCLVVAVQKGFGGKRLEPELLDYLTPLIPSRPVSVVSGWDNHNGKVTKMFDEEDDETLTGEDGTYNGEPVGAEPVDTGDGVEPDGDELDPTLADGDGDEMALDMKAGAQFAHALHDKIMDAIGFVEEAAGGQEHDGILKFVPKAQAMLAKLMAALQDAYAKYQSEHSDQPELPEFITGGDEVDGFAEDADGDEVEVVEKEGDDTDADFESFAGDDEKDEKEEKALKAWVTKARDAWENWKRAESYAIADAQMDKVQRVAKSLDAMRIQLASGKADVKKLGRVCKGMKDALDAIQPEKVGIVTKAATVPTTPKDDDAEMMEALAKSGILDRVNTVETALRKFTDR